MLKFCGILEWQQLRLKYSFNPYQETGIFMGDSN